MEVVFVVVLVVGVFLCMKVVVAEAFVVCSAVVRGAGGPEVRLRWKVFYA